MDLLIKSKGKLLQFLCLWAWFCLVLLGSSLTDSQVIWNTHPLSQEVEQGSTVTFTCSASYRQKSLEYLWYHDNQSIDSDQRFMVTDGTLKITNTKVDDQGSYQCYAKRINRDKILGKSNEATLNVKGVCSAAVISTKPSGRVHLTGTELQIRCKCYMYPNGTYTFSKDGSPMTSGGRITVDGNKVYINNATKDDSGKYSCMATAQDSSVTRQASDLAISVIVGQHPQFQNPPQTKYVVLEGSQVIIPCKAIGDPQPVIKWYAADDTTPLKDDSKYTIYSNGSLEISSVERRDAIKYKCSATNMVGTIAKDTRVELAYLDDVTLDKKTTLYVLKNHKTEVLCNKPAGSPEPTITWLKADGQALPYKFNVTGCCTLQKDRIKMPDTGNYTCTAKNTFGTKSRTIQIIVSEQPQITQKPVSQKLKEDEKAVLNCTATSNPPAKITWMKDNDTLKADSNHMFVETDGGLGKRLVIAKAKPRDTGVYRCLADHPGGWGDNAEAKLEVMGKVKLRGIPYYVVNAHLHKRHTIECDFDGYPPISITWKKEVGIQIKNNKRIKVDNNVLSFTQVEKEDAGQYWCTGKNSFSTHKSYVNISVYVYPTFELVPKNTTAYVDDHIWLHCNASGDPKPKISWSKDTQGGDKLDPKRFIQHPNGTLHIKEVHKEDQGGYYCIAANHAEMKQSKFSLDVEDKPGVNARGNFGQNDHPPPPPPPPKSDEPSVGSMGRTIGIAVGCAAAYIVLVVGLMIYCKGRRARQSKKQEIAAPECEELNNGDVERQSGEDGNDMTMNPVYRSQPSYDRMEFPRHDLEALRSLGNGAYGRAFLARASGIRDGERETIVVVKSLVYSSDGQVREEFNKEMDALGGVQHDNVVALLGVCKEEEPCYMIFESMEKGDLKQFLLSCYDNGRSTMNSNQKLAICAQVASGMNYLSSRDFVHKDLAARNCMVGKDLQVKIGFLSLCYDLYSAEYYRFNNVHIPLRWMPPEAIFDDDFSEKSDVWSYGVLLWEIYNFGQMPYNDRSNEEVLKCVKDDLRLPKPDNCPDTVLEVLEKCWEGNPLARPTFSELLDDVSGISVDSHV